MALLLLVKIRRTIPKWFRSVENHSFTHSIHPSIHPTSRPSHPFIHSFHSILLHTLTSSQKTGRQRAKETKTNCTIPHFFCYDTRRIFLDRVAYIRNRQINKSSSTNSRRNYDLWILNLMWNNYPKSKSKSKEKKYYKRVDCTVSFGSLFLSNFRALLFLLVVVVAVIVVVGRCYCFSVCLLF